MHLPFPPFRRPLPLFSFSIPALFATMTTTPSSPQSTFPTRPYTPRHTSFPYTPSDFTRADPSPDPSFYSSPRFVTHIDDNAISLLRTYYQHNLPSRGRVLDLCSSWISHFPPSLEKAALAFKGKKNSDGNGLEVLGLGMNKAELAANPILSSAHLQDLNTNPTIPTSLSPVSATACVVSIDYLIHPVEVLSSLFKITEPGGKVHLVISNRCFPTKAVGRWLRVSEEERLQMVGDYLWWSGWRDVEIVTVCDGKGEGGWWGGRPDPLWVVRGVKVGGGEVRGEL